MLPMLVDSLSGVLPFLAWFGLSLALLLAFKWIYTAITPHDEWRLIREQRNTAAAIALGGSLVGFALPVASAAAHSVSFVDFVVWAVVAVLAQVLAFLLLRAVYLRDLFSRIEAGETAAGVLLAAFSLAVGVLNAACMTY